jgi:hypothetical protein
MKSRTAHSVNVFAHGHELQGYGATDSADSRLVRARTLDEGLGDSHLVQLRGCCGRTYLMEGSQQLRIDRSDLGTLHGKGPNALHAVLGNAIVSAHR